MKFGHRPQNWFAALVLLGLFGSNAAEAAPTDAFGASSATVGRAGGVVADVSPADAVLLNPARLSFAQNVDAVLDLTVSDDQFKIDDQDAGLDTFVGLRVAVAGRIPLGSLSDRLFLGLTAMFPTSGLYVIENPVPSSPRVIQRDATVRHVEVAAAAAIRLWRTLAVGAGMTLGPHATGLVNIDFAHENANQTLINIDYNVAPIVSLAMDPVPDLSLGFTWRGANRTHYAVPANVLVSDQIGGIHARLSGVNFGDPDRFTIGAAYDFSDLAPTPLARFKARLELGLEHYRKDISSVSNVELLDVNDQVLTQSERLPFDFHDTWHLATSLDWMPLDTLTVMLGYAWQTTPVPAQRGLLNLLDASHSTVSAGITAWLPEQWLSSPRQVGFSTAAMVGIYQRREMEKYDVLPGYTGYPNITFDGFDFSWHLSVYLNF